MEIYNKAKIEMQGTLWEPVTIKDKFISHLQVFAIGLEFNLFLGKKRTWHSEVSRGTYLFSSSFQTGDIKWWVVFERVLLQLMSAW